MKKIIAAVCCIVCIISSSCHKDSKVIPNDYYIRASKDNIGWGAVLSTYKIAGDSLRLSGFEQTGELHLNIDIKFNGNGTYKIGAGQAEYFTTIGLDALTSDFYSDPAQLNVLVINSYSPKTNIISGTFELHMLSFQDINVGTAFRTGTFRVKLPD